MKRKGCRILISKNILSSVLVLKNDINGRYIKVSIQIPKSQTPLLLLSSVYLE